MLQYFLDFLFPPRGDEGIVRTLSEEDFLSLVTPKVVAKTDPPTIALLPFHNDQVRSMVHEAKYHGNAKSFSLLATAVAEYLRDHDSSFFKPTFVLVPVPLGIKRRRERGFNQVEEVLKRASKKLAIPLASDLLVRVRETTSQVSLPRFDRAQNMKNAFKVNPSAYGRDATYVLVDDVVTTGATLEACISALKSAGITNILPLAFAH